MIRVPRPVRWMLVVIGLVAGWAAGNLLDVSSHAREATPPPLPATAPVR
jgi:hypothetical protein